MGTNDLSKELDLNDVMRRTGLETSILTCLIAAKANKISLIDGVYNNIKDACKNSDLLIIHTEWIEFKQLNFNKLNTKKKFKIFDVRNLYSPLKMKQQGIKYFAVGK